MHNFTSQSLPAMPQDTILHFSTDFLDLQQVTLFFKDLCAIYINCSEIPISIEKIRLISSTVGT